MSVKMENVNIFMYGGSNYMDDLSQYLSANGVDVTTIELMNGMIGFWRPQDKKPVLFPQYTQGKDILKGLKKG